MGKDQKHPLHSNKIQVLNTWSHHQWFGITWIQPQTGKGIWGFGEQREVGMKEETSQSVWKKELKKPLLTNQELNKEKRS